MGRWYKCAMCSYRNEGIFFNDCVECDSDICDGCFNESTGLCDDCASKKHSRKSSSTSEESSS